jgi:hypothetical protein
MGTWSSGLYGNDDAADLRDDLKEVLRAPWDGDRLLAWVVARFPAAANPADTSYPDLRLALADQFWLYGIEHAETRDEALRIVEEDVDLDAKRALGLDERGLARRALYLAELADKWRSPNPSPRRRRMLEKPEPFVLETGDCLVYATARGRVRNPYVSPRKEESFYGRFPWEQDGWAAAIVLARLHRFDVFARYLVAILRWDGSAPASPADFAGLSILHSRTFMPATRRVHLVSTSKQHLLRMRVEVVGRLDVDEEEVEAEFAPELRRSGRELANDAWTLPDLYDQMPERFAPADVDDPIGRFFPDARRTR